MSEEVELKEEENPQTNPIDDVGDELEGMIPSRHEVYTEKNGNEVHLEDHRDGQMEFVDYMQVPTSITIVAKRNSGKSYFIRHFVKKLAMTNRVSIVIAFSKTAILNNTFDWLPSNMVFNGYSELIMRAIFRMMSEKIMQIKEEATRKRNSNMKAPHLMIILDDVVGETLSIGEESKKQSTGRCQTLSDIYAMGRHFKTSIIVSSQTATVVLNPTVRNNTDYLFIGPNNEDAMFPLYKSTIGFSSLVAFRLFAQETVVDHAMLMYDNLDAMARGVKWLVIRAPSDDDPFVLRFDSKQRAKKRKRNKSEEKKRARARQDQENEHKKKLIEATYREDQEEKNEDRDELEIATSFFFGGF